MLLMVPLLMVMLLMAASAASLFAQLAAPNPAGVSIGHVHIIVSDPAAQKQIWVGVLGAQVTNTGTLELLRLPGIFIVLGQARTAPTGGSDGSTVNHISFLVKSYADTKAKLAAASVPFISDDAKNKQFIADFPEHVRVEFTEDSKLNVPLQFQRMNLVSVDPGKLRAWYVKTFGGRDGTRGQVLTAVFPGGEVDFTKADAPAAPTKGRSLDHIGFELVGLEAFCKKLEAEGMAFDGTYRALPALGGLQIAYILDPEGTRIEMTEGFMAKSH